MPNTFKYNIQARETKKNGTLYDLYFYIETAEGRKQKKLSGFKTKKLARQAYEQFMATYIAAPKKYDGKYDVFYEDAFKAYLGAVHLNIKESTIYDIKHIFSTHVDDFFCGRKMPEIKKSDLISWLDGLWTKTRNGKPYSQKTLMRVYSFFSSFYNWCAVHYGFENALNDVKPPKRRDVEEPRTFWTECEFERFVACIDSLKYRAIFTTLFYCGCRIGELQALTPKDYDGKQFYIHSSFTQKTTDGSPYRITETKNYKSRTVPLPQKAIVVIDEWIQYKQKHKMPNKYIFGSDNPPSRHAIQVQKDSAIEKAGVKRIRIHDFRHSYVSLLMAKGVNFGVIAALIGDTLEQVVKTYAHHVEDDKAIAVSLL